MVKSSPLKPEFVEEIKKRLLADKTELAQDIERLADEDPLMNPERTAESVPEFEEASSQMQGSERIAEEKKVLEKRLEETEESLKRIEEGSYGICKNYVKHFPALGKACFYSPSRKGLEGLPSSPFLLGL